MSIVMSDEEYIRIKTKMKQHRWLSEKEIQSLFDLIDYIGFAKYVELDWPPSSGS